MLETACNSRGTAAKLGTGLEQFKGVATRRASQQQVSILGDMWIKVRGMENASSNQVIACSLMYLLLRKKLVFRTMPTFERLSFGGG